MFLLFPVQIPMILLWKLKLSINLSEAWTSATRKVGWGARIGQTAVEANCYKDERRSDRALLPAQVLRSDETRNPGNWKFLSRKISSCSHTWTDNSDGAHSYPIIVRTIEILGVDKRKRGDRRSLLSNRKQTFETCLIWPISFYLSRLISWNPNWTRSSDGLYSMERLAPS